MVDAVAALNGSLGADSTKSGSKKALSGLADNFDNFLKLFLAQLKNQDPTQPMDTNDMTAQLAQFAEVEQTIASNTKLEELIAQTKSSEVTNAGALVGTVVKTETSKVELRDGVADIDYTVDIKNANQATIVFKDKDGKVVYTAGVESSLGEHGVTWAGKDNKGNKLADGVYTVEVSLTDEEGKVSPLKTIASSLVTGVNIKNGTSTLQLTNGDEIDSSKILFVGNKLTFTSDV